MKAELLEGYLFNEGGFADRFANNDFHIEPDDKDRLNSLRWEVEQQLCQNGTVDESTFYVFCKTIKSLLEPVDLLAQVDQDDDCQNTLDLVYHLLYSNSNK